MYKDKGSYRFGKSGRLQLNPGIRDGLRELMHEKGIQPAAERIAQVANQSSSWGFYKALHGEQTSAVVALQAADKDSERGRRLLSALDRGKEAFE